MRESRGLLILLVGVVLTAGLVWFFTRPKPPVPTEVAPPPVDPAAFHFTDVPTRSPELEVKDLWVGGSMASDYTSWVVTATCAEPQGCVGVLVAEVRYTSGKGKDDVRLGSVADVPAGAEIRFSKLQNGHHPVDGITRVTIEVTSREVPDSSSEILL